MTISVKPLPGGIGCEVLDIDTDQELGADRGEELRALWREHGLLLFRRAGHSPGALLNLSRCFGTLEQHPIPQFRMDGYPELILLTNEGGPRGPVYMVDEVPTYGHLPWHTDLAFTTVPNAGALLRMVQKPAHGGKTGWLDTTAAYRALDGETRRLIDGLEALYVFCKDLSGVRFQRTAGPRVGESNLNIPDYPPVVRPLVSPHPVTGEPILNLSALNIQSIVGMDEAESDALIERLLAHITQPRFCYLHDWEVDDIMLWDNYRMMHRATGHPVDEVRMVQRSTLKGDAAIGRLAGQEAVAA